MLQLQNIVKTYVTGEQQQYALKDVSISFRENEFVSILGQSGSGKTTMLNIIGGLDRYDSGDLIINGVSTQEYRDTDWDYYRNNSIGFVFQSYNLIPHQTVLANVEMALTLAGISKKERRERSITVLEKVGLGNQLHKKPNQMSGGQMQRVAIARALINNPDILLADEPTGALDSETSIHIMELLKEIAKDKLVIMVTHNPELAEQYSTRIVKLLDGRIVSDTNTFEEKEAEGKNRKNKKISMSFLTALSLSFDNLRTKKGRTLLTSFAGSIGIIGIALILALSTGMNAYITDIQKETLTAYPLIISEETIDLSGAMEMHGEMMNMTLGEEQQYQEREGVYADYRDIETREMIATNIVENNLTSFKKYLDHPDSDIRQYLGENGVVYTYDVAFSVYSYNADGKLINSDAEVQEDSSSMMSSGQYEMFANMESSIMGGNALSPKHFSELIPGADGSLINPVIKKNYDMVYGDWPENYNEVILVLTANNGISAGTLFQLGLITEEQYEEAVKKIESGQKAEEILINYEDVCKQTFYLVAACDHYMEEENGTFTYIKEGEIYEERLLDNAVALKIAGIVRPKPDSENASISTTVGYTSKLTDVIIAHTDESAVIQAQEADKEKNVLTGMEFEALDEDAKVADAKEYLGAFGISEKASFYQLMVYYASANTESVIPVTASGMITDEASMASAFDIWLANNPNKEILLKVYDEYIAGATYEDNMKAFGKVSYDAPASISIYTDSFENKNAIADCIEVYNKGVDEDEKITYTDYVAMLTSSITTIIDGISYVLVAFVAISLIVSCIMIGIITHISVMERTKEIGILRALGASRRNISQVFNAETFIIGCCAGLLGIGVSLLALFPINRLIEKVSGIAELDAQLPMESSVILVAISIVITMIGGLLPARKAAKKDPVIALRTE